ncbi:MAG: WecB/TagA/CpsF family glycosyltransferase [Oscillospiraceae bacterium]|nr:WecB/TagA/CpsF family glycosyltransferase [Oscillospiraceae bacterium]
MSVNVLGVDFDNVTLSQAVSRALALLDRPGGYVVTPNAEILLNTAHDAHARLALTSADLILPDGVSVVRAAKKLGRPLKERVTGFDFAEALMAACNGKRFYLLGAKEGVARAAGRRLSRKYGIVIAGTQNGFYKDEAAVLEHIRECSPDVLFVCLGSPRQEIFMLDNKSALGGCLMIGLGGCLDIWSGKLKRAPKPFIALRLEWLYRMLRQPSRFGRVLKLRRFYPAVNRQRKAEKKKC